MIEKKINCPGRGSTNDMALALAPLAPASHLSLAVEHLSEYALRALPAGQVRIRQHPVDLDDPSDAPRPAGLMAGAHARAGVAVEVLVEQEVVPPQGIGLELLRTAEYRT